MIFSIRYLGKIVQSSQDLGKSHRPTLFFQNFTIAYVKRILSTKSVNW